MFADEAEAPIVGFLLTVVVEICAALATHKSFITKRPVIISEVVVWEFFTGDCVEVVEINHSEVGDHESCRCCLGFLRQ